MDSISFKEFQNKVLEIYNETTEIFRKNNIKLWAHSGTLLGIIRHDESFIPWDDDIDLMVSYKEYIQNKSKIVNELNSPNSNIYMIDFKNDNIIIDPNMNFIRVFSRHEYKISYEDHMTTSRPFIDIFFAGPSNTFKSEFGWWYFSVVNKSMWTMKPGFNRYHKSVNKKTKTFLFNLISLPMKLIPSSILDKYIEKKFEGKNKNWNSLRRMDAWSNRKIEYQYSLMKLSKINGCDILISQNYEKELKESYGKNWEEEKSKTPHIFSEKHLNIRRNRDAQEFLRKKFNIN